MAATGRPADDLAEHGDGSELHARSRARRSRAPARASSSACVARSGWYRSSRPSSRRGPRSPRPTWTVGHGDRRPVDADDGRRGDAVQLTVAGCELRPVVALLAPIDTRAKAWTPATAPPDWREQIGRWDRFHVARVAMIVAAFSGLTAAVAG